jgi:hypothetical protein
MSIIERTSHHIINCALHRAYYMLTPHFLSHLSQHHIYLPPNFQSPLGSLSPSQNHYCGITIKLTFILLPYNLSLMGIQKATQCVPHASRPSTSRKSSKSRPGTQSSNWNLYIRMCVDRSPCPPAPGIASMSYSSTITHATSLFGTS